MFFLGSSSYSTNNPNASAAERGELLWDRERERIKKKEKEKEIAAKMAVSINELISCVQFDLGLTCNSNPDSDIQYFID